jgi:hypothetical protein
MNNIVDTFIGSIYLLVETNVEVLYFWFIRLVQSFTALTIRLAIKEDRMLPLAVAQSGRGKRQGYFLPHVPKGAAQSIRDF